MCGTSADRSATELASGYMRRQVSTGSGVDWLITVSREMAAVALDNDFPITSAKHAKQTGNDYK